MQHLLPNGENDNDDDNDNDNDNDWNYTSLMRISTTKPNTSDTQTKEQNASILRSHRLLELSTALLERSPQWRPMSLHSLLTC